MGNNDFKKMDLNFDDTFEAEVKPNGLSNQNNTSTFNFNDKSVPSKSLSPNIFSDYQNGANNNQYVQIPDRDFQTIIQETTQERRISELEKQIYLDILSDVEIQKSASVIANDNSVGVPTKRDLTKTIEFIVQAEKADDEEIRRIRHNRMMKKKIAKKSRFNAYIWVFIGFLSIIFGLTSILTFGSNINDFISSISGENDDSFLNEVGEFFKIFFSSFEAMLFMFFIFLSFKKYFNFIKPYKLWFNETEPLRTAEEYKKEIKKHNQLLEKMTIYQLSWLPPVRKKIEGRLTLKEKLSNLKQDNAILSKTIKNHESNSKKVK